MTQVYTDGAKIFEKAGDLLKETGWTREAWARNAEGEHVFYTAPDCVCYCLAGALSKAWTLLGVDSKALSLVYDTVEQLCGMPVVTWNDKIERTAEEVIDLTNRGAKFLKGHPDYQAA